MDEQTPKKKNPIDELKKLVSESLNAQNEIKDELQQQSLNFQDVNKQLVNSTEILKNTVSENVREINSSTKIARQGIENSSRIAGQHIDETIGKKLKSLNSVKVDLNDKDKKLLDAIQSNFNLFKTLKYVVGAMLLISVIALLGSGYLAKKWYDTSVQTKQEVRAELLEEIRSKGDVITSDAYLTALRHEKDMLKGWVNANPEDSKSYKTHRKAIMNIEDNKTAIFFESPTSNELGKGGKAGFFD